MEAEDAAVVLGALIEEGVVEEQQRQSIRWVLFRNFPELLLKVVDTDQSDLAVVHTTGSATRSRNRGAIIGGYRDRHGRLQR
jgi:hypothetical protein